MRFAVAYHPGGTRGGASVGAVRKEGGERGVPGKGGRSGSAGLLGGSGGTGGPPEGRALAAVRPEGAVGQRQRALEVRRRST
ncbi:hypothetical protein C0R04_29560 [Streptomyces albidoflavus]|uniref:Uncharacterized protein n=1 Tax=Streptomyces albidoflavus TaxID=1886 RepID=A0AB37X8Z0_9ACTN|nr:hypothetical protein B9S66_00795 [Streptomyces sp. SM17]RZE32131.1 hypothetical protein C0Q91_30205 [Streptomyces albidoflavus]RZE87020.1 hypothetical protein C0R04_29560 [Streptomyces albidoflavus]RZE88002.1 hypothetical protein C0R03_29570 [Streptomyces albidoflavus]